MTPLENIGIGLSSTIGVLIMGITRLGEFLKKTHPLVLRHKEAISFKRRTVAIDASNTIYTFLAKTTCML